MDAQTLINIGAGAVLATIGWLYRTLYDAVERLKSDVKGIEICLPSNYVQKQDMLVIKHDIEARFDKIDMTLEKLFEKLDTKADK